MNSRVLEALLAFLPRSAMDTSKSPEESPAEKPSNLPQIDEPNSSSSLNSFEATMKALDEVLSQRQQESAKPSSLNGQLPSVEASKADKKKGNQKATIEDEITMEEDSDSDVEGAMHAELQRLLDSDHCDEPLDYNLIKSFLESFKSQGGLSGPVSNLAGRLAPDLKFPRDST